MVGGMIQSKPWNRSVLGTRIVSDFKGSAQELWNLITIEYATKINLLLATIPIAAYGKKVLQTFVVQAFMKC